MKLETGLNCMLFSFLFGLQRVGGGGFESKFSSLDNTTQSRVSWVASNNVYACKDDLCIIYFSIYIPLWWDSNKNYAWITVYK